MRPLPTLILLTAFLASPLCARNSPAFPSDETHGALAQPADADLAPLPLPLSPERLSALQLAPSAGAPCACPRQHRLSYGFFRSMYLHPLTPQQVAMRSAIYELAQHPKQYVRLRLTDHTTVTGTITNAQAQHFVLTTGPFTGFRMINYQQLAEPPRPVAAVGTHIVHGLQATATLGIFVVVAPIALPLMMAGVLND
jgi:hypothetical protein